MNDGDSLGLMCSECGSSDTIHTSVQGGAWWFLCRECGAEFSLQAHEPQLERLERLLSAAGYPSHQRPTGLGVMVAFKRTDGSQYALEWVIDDEPLRVRKMLDYDGWRPVAEPTVAAVLAAIEAAEMADSRAGWPDMPQYHVAGLAEV